MEKDGKREEVREKEGVREREMEEWKETRRERDKGVTRGGAGMERRRSLTGSESDRKKYFICIKKPINCHENRPRKTTTKNENNNLQNKTTN